MMVSSNCRNKGCTVMIGGKSFLNQPVKNNLTKYDSVKKMQQIKEIIKQLVVC